MTTYTTEWIDRDGNLHIVTAGDSRTVRAGYLWQSTTKRDDGLHEHIYKRHDGKG